MATEGLTSGWRGGGGAGKGLRGFEGSRVSRASGRGLQRSGGGCLGCQTGQGQRRGQGMSGGGEAQHPGSPGDPGFQAPAPSSLRPGSPRRSPLPQNSECEPLAPFTPRSRSLGLQPLLPSDLGLHVPSPALHESPVFGPPAPSCPEPRSPHLLFSPSWSPALWGLRGRGQLVAMVPDCLGLLSDPWGLPRVCREGEGDPDLGEVQRQPFPQIRPMGPGSSGLHQGLVQ